MLWEIPVSGRRPRRRRRVLGWLASGAMALAAPSAMAQGLNPPPTPVPFDQQQQPQQQPIPFDQQQQQPLPDVQGDPGVQVLTRGPIHEAFAESVAYNPVMNPIVPKSPPAPVEEQPPDQRPEGADVEWIPGYWAWDDERNDFIWISGIWRDIPPGRQWVPGYWVQAENGFQWTSGFWTSTGEQELVYLPAGPPQSLENGPNSPQPGENFAWIPGSWTWAENRYVWRPGYWIQTQPEWIWMPSRYVPTPSGYVYVDGYWDYPLAQRGLTFAPVAFTPTVLARPNYSYTPFVALAAGGLLANLFVRPNQSNYYFGDYYGAGRGPNAGYIPWFERQQHRSGYDPIYSQMSVINARREPNWDRRLRDDYQYRFDHNDARPAPTFIAERARLEQRRARGEDIRDLSFARPLNQFNQGSNPGRRLVAVNQEQRSEFVRRQAEVQKFREARQAQEVAARRPANARPDEDRPRQLPLNRSPIFAGGRGGRNPQGPNPVAAAPARPEQHNAFRPAIPAGAGNGNNRPNQGPGAGPNRGPGDGPGPNRGPGDGPNRGPGAGPGPNRGPGDGPNRGPGAGPNRGPGAGPNRGPGDGPGNGPRNPGGQPRPQPAPQPQPQPQPTPQPQPQPQPQPAPQPQPQPGPRPGGRPDGNGPGRGNGKPGGGNKPGNPNGPQKKGDSAMNGRPVGPQIPNRPQGIAAMNPRPGGFPMPNRPQGVAAMTQRPGGQAGPNRPQGANRPQGFNPNPQQRPVAPVTARPRPQPAPNFAQGPQRPRPQPPGAQASPGPRPGAAANPAGPGPGGRKPGKPDQPKKKNQKPGD